MYRKGGGILKKINYLCLQVTKEGQASYAHVHEIIDGLKKRGWDVELYQPSYVNKNISPTVIQKFLGYIFAQLKLIFECSNKDIIYIRSHFGAFLVALWARVFKIPVIQEVNGPYEDLFVAWPWTRKFSKLFIFLMKKQLIWANDIIVVTDQLKEWINKEIHREKNIFVIPNGANTEIFTPTANTNFKNDKEFVVFFGNLEKWQGIDTILKAADQEEWPENLEILFIGDGSERSKIEISSKANDKIKYLGKIPYKKLPGIINQSIASLSPQNNAGDRANKGLYPLKVFESLSCGVPVIVTDFPGQADLVRQNNCGLVIPPEDSEALAKAVNWLMKNKDARKKMGEKGREIIVKEHSWYKRSLQTEEILKKYCR
jgi:glycosyltransferase involved in cell wall biosynthesis